MVEWWRFGGWPSVSYLRRWVTCEWNGLEAEVRVFPGPAITTAVVRLRLWLKVVYCEPGRSRNVERLGSEGIGDEVAAFLRRATAVPGGTDGDKTFPDPKFAKDWPALYEYMTLTKWPEGGDRKPCSLTLFAEDGSLKGCLSEKNDGLVLFCAGKTLVTMLNALEGLLTAQDTPWRKSGGGMAPKGGKGRGGS